MSDNKTTYRARVHENWSMDQFEVFLRGSVLNESGSITPKIIFETISEGHTSEPFLVGDEGRDILQVLVDAAFEFGIVPRQLEDHRSELKATKGHLDDMRCLTFGLLEMEGCKP